MTRMNKIGTHETHVRKEGDVVIVRYHDTDVVTVSPDRIVLDTGGWFTPTTKQRMNQAAQVLGLPYTVYQSNHKWYVVWKFYGGERIIPFDGDSLVLERGEK